MVEDQKYRLIDNKLMRIENRLRKIEILLLKNVTSEKKIKEEIESLEKEERIIEKEQKKLESHEKDILKDIIYIEKEEKWSNEIRYSCPSKDLDGDIIRCLRTGKLCSLDTCPIVNKEVS